MSDFTVRACLLATYLIASAVLYLDLFVWRSM
jgi:hypothetical protein